MRNVELLMPFLVVKLDFLSYYIFRNNSIDNRMPSPSRLGARPPCATLLHPHSAI